MADTNTPDPNKQFCRVTACDRQGHMLAYEVVQGTYGQCVEARGEVHAKFLQTYPGCQIYFNWNQEKGRHK